MSLGIEDIESCVDQLGQTSPTNIHSKSEQIGGDLLLSTEKLAEKVRMSGRQNFRDKRAFIMKI